MHNQGHQKISIIIPALNESIVLPNLLQILQPMRARGHEVIVVDGGSEDGTAGLASNYCDSVLRSARGRSTQMAHGVEKSSGEILWFLHADVIPPANADQLILDAFTCTHKAWGRFDVKLTGTHPMLGVIGKMMNLRSCLTGIATGDQGIFVSRSVLEQIGGMPAIPLMEDIKLSKLLRKIHKPLCINEYITVSGRRWQEYGVLRTMMLMWYLRLLYALGVNPAKLSRLYK